MDSMSWIYEDWLPFEQWDSSFRWECTDILVLINKVDNHLNAQKN